MTCIADKGSESQNSLNSKTFEKDDRQLENDSFRVTLVLDAVKNF
jgi:hypothetical protein